MLHPTEGGKFGQNIFLIIFCFLLASTWYFVPHPLFIIALSILPIVLFVSITQPFLVILGFIIFSFFRIHEAYPALYSLRIPQMLAIGSMLIIFWHLIITKKIEMFWSRELSAFFTFFGLVTIGLLFSSNRDVAINAWSGNYVKIAVMVLAIVWLTREAKDFSLATRVFVFSGIAIGHIALLNKYNNIGLVEGTRVTISRDIGSMLGDPNDLALVLLFPASFSLALLFVPGLNKFDRILGLVGFLVVLSAIIATQSRGGLLGIISVLGFFFLLKIRSKIVLLSLAIMGILFLFAVAGISDRASGGAVEQGVDESAMGRVYAWGAAVKMALHNPITGVGIDNFFVNYFFYSDHWDGKNHAVHSTWFGVLAETGFVGLIVFVYFVIRISKTAFRSNQLLADPSCKIMTTQPSVNVMAKATTAGLVGFVVSGTFLTQGFTWPIYILLALIIATHRYIIISTRIAN